MASLPILTSLDIALSDEVVRDLFTPGKTFKQNILSGARALGPAVVDMAGDRVSQQPSDTLLEVELEKVDETVIKLFIRVYRPECHDQQTEVSVTLSDTFSQSDELAATDSLTQTDTNATNSLTQTDTNTTDSLTQTDTKVLEDVSVQTDETRLRQSFLDAVSSTDFNMSTQVDGVAMATAESATSYTQTEVKLATSAMQTERNATSRRIQTDPPAIEDGAMQTDPLPIATIEVQTDSSMSRLEDAQAQVSVEMNDKPMQTELVQTETDSQTDLSMALQKDGEAQASAEVASNLTQTEVELGEISSQTDMSMALQTDSESQCVVELSELASQTELSQGEASSQTSISMALQAEQETQATSEVADGLAQTDISQSLQGDQSTQMTTEVSDGDVQTDISQSLQGDQSTQMTTEMNDSFIQTDQSQSLQGEQETQTSDEMNTTTGHDSTLPSSQQSATSTEGPANDDIPSNQGVQTFTEIVDRSERKRRSSVAAEMRDGISQTDPVTIIIGDASFLVKKLKSSAVSPSKVTQSGNEIEIELSAEVTGGTAEEKENDLQGYPPSTLSHLESVTRANPMIRGATPGVAIRQPMSGGVRVRMPMSMQSPRAMVRPPYGQRIHPGPPVRFASPAMIRTPVRQGPAPRQQAHLSSGGTFSCPFCSLIFIDSPALYEHLSENHQGDQKSKWKQPKGREGKTIIPRGKPRSPERGPPVLTPIEPLSTQPQVTQFIVPGPRAAAAANNAEEEEVAHEAGLFEDPVETAVVKKRRGRQPKAKNQDADADASLASDEEVVATPGKRKRKDADGGGSKRARLEEQWEEVEEGDDVEEEEEEEEPIPVKATPSRRGGRTPRARTK